MPLIYKKELSPQGLTGIWQIEEIEEFFLQKVILYPQETEQLNAIKGFRRLEWLACRHLIHELSERDIRGAILKDPFGKPFLEESLWEISMSHSHGKAAVIAAPCLVGVDIQKIVPRITHLASKFIHEDEKLSIRDSAFSIEAMHVIWGAKESLFKAYGKGNIDFKRDLRVHHFDFHPSGGKFKCEVLNKHFTHQFDGYYEQIDDFIFVHILEELGLIAFKM
jgi:4'-phosphopantetheinyl transferase